MQTVAGSANYGLLSAVVLLGSLLPVVPTGAAVSAAAALAVHGTGGSLTLVLVAAATAALAGDSLSFAVARLGGRRALLWASRRRPDAVDRARRRLERQGAAMLVISRLIPAGRVPALAAAGALRYPWGRFLAAEAVAVLLWSASYAALGVAGGSAFASAWVAAAAAVVLVLIVEGVVQGVARLRARPRRGSSEQPS